MLYYEEIIYNSTIHFDFNFPAKMFQSVEMAPKSQIFFNGIDKREIRWYYEEDQGVMWNQNIQDESVWEFPITDFKLKEKTIIKMTYPEIPKTAILSSTDNFISLPINDFEEFSIKLM